MVAKRDPPAGRFRRFRVRFWELLEERGDEVCFVLYMVQADPVGLQYASRDCFKAPSVSSPFLFY